MEQQERRMVVNGSAEVDISSPLMSLPVLAGYVDNDDYLRFIKRHASNDEWEQGHLVDLFLAGDDAAGEKIKSRYLASLEAKQRSSGYCVVCALALGFDAGVGETLGSGVEAKHAR